MNKIRDITFVRHITSMNKNKFTKQCKFILSHFGTSLRCNRFTIGNCIEYAVNDLLCENGYKTISLSNHNKYDIYIHRYGPVSIKYSSSGAIRLQNNIGYLQNYSNTDNHIVKTMIITPLKTYIISNTLLEPYLNINEYLQYRPDSIILRRSILKNLEKLDYPFIVPIDISVDEVHNNECSKIIWNYAKDNTD